MVRASTQPKLAWLVLAIVACVAAIGFEQGLKSALAAPRAALPGETAAGAAAAGVAPRIAGAPEPLDEARVHEIAREEADAAIARAKPAPKKPKIAPVEDPEDAAADAAPPAATPPASPQDQPSNPDQPQG